MPRYEGSGVHINTNIGIDMNADPTTKRAHHLWYLIAFGVLMTLAGVGITLRASTTRATVVHQPEAALSTLDDPTNTEASSTTATTTTAASTTTTTASPTTTTATATTVATTTAVPAVNPIAGAQGSTVLCNTGDLSAIAITQSFIMRDFVTGEDLVDHFDGAQATMSLSGGAGTTSQDTSTVVGGMVTFNFVLSQPTRPTERLILSLQIGGVSVPVSVNSIGYSTGVCTF